MLGGRFEAAGRQLPQGDEVDIPIPSKDPGAGYCLVELK